MLDEAHSWIVIDLARLTIKSVLIPALKCIIEIILMPPSPFKIMNYSGLVFNALKDKFTSTTLLRKDTILLVLKFPSTFKSLAKTDRHGTT
jgi:hypothetical protein